MGTVRMEHLGLESHLGRLVRELLWESQPGLVESSLEGCAFGSLEADPPLEEISIFKSDRYGKISFAALSNWVRGAVRSNCFLMCSMASFRLLPYIASRIL
jgi:hypothetical protein